MIKLLYLVFTMFAQGISRNVIDITDSILDELNDWRDRPLKKCYAFVFVDCLYVTLQHDYESAVRKVIYTTNAIEVNNSSLRKVTKIIIHRPSRWFFLCG